MKAGLTVCRVEGGYAPLKLTICIVVIIFLLGLMASFQVRAVTPPKSKECDPQKESTPSQSQCGTQGRAVRFWWGVVAGDSFPQSHLVERFLI